MRAPVSAVPHLRWIVYGTAALVPIALGLLSQPFLANRLGPSWWVLLIALAQLLTVAAMGLVRRLAPAPRPSDRATQLLEATARALPRLRERTRMLGLIARILVRCFEAAHATVYLVNAERSTYHLVASHGPARCSRIVQLETDSPLAQWLREHHTPLRPADCQSRPDGTGLGASLNPYRRLHFILENLNAQVIVPSFSGRRLLGFLVLGERLNRRPYTEAEVTALVRLSRECAAALETVQSAGRLETVTSKLQSAEERLVRQERMVAAGRLAMGLAHEIKNPLAAIKTFAEFLPERHQDPTFLQEFAAIVSKEVDRISRIVQSLSDFAKPVLLKIETTDVQKVLKDTATLLSNDCLKRNVTIEQQLEPTSILLPADPGQLKQVILNLCVNALDAMPQGGTLTVSCRLDRQDACIQITDTGTGIAPEHLPHLFDPFFSTKDAGMGLGLSVVKQIVEQHLGTIQVESHVGQGSTFDIRLPLAVKFTPGTWTDRRGPGDGAMPESQRLSAPLEVLVVDDEPKIRDLLKEGCEVLGCRVRAAASGEEALRLADVERPQLVLLDLKLEAMDGFTVLRELKQRDPGLPVIVITGSSDADVDQRVQDLGALTCLHKPLDLPALQSRVRELAEHLASPRR